MRRLVPVRTSRENVKFDADGEPIEYVACIEYEMLDVTDDQYNKAIDLMSAMVPGPWRDKSKM